MTPVWNDPLCPPRDWQVNATEPVLKALRAGQRPLIHAVMGAGKSVYLSALVRYFLSRMSSRSDLRIIVGTSSQKLVRQLSATLAEWVGARSVGQFYASSKQVGRPVIVACYDSVALLTQRMQAAGLTCFLFVADEAHKTEAPETRAAISTMAPRLLMGVTATPFRSQEGECLSLFTPLATANKPGETGAVFSYGLVDALNDGVLVPPVWKTAERRGLDTDEWCVANIREQAIELGPGIVSAFDIADATAFAERLSEEGMPALPIHSRLKRDEQERRLKSLQAGELKALVHVSLLTEGVDLPWLRWLCARRKVSARVRFAQEVGRVLRTIREPDAYGSKAHALVLDPHALSKRLSLGGRAELGEAIAGLDRKAKPKEKPVFDLPHILPQEREIPPTQVADAAGAWAGALLANLAVAGLARYDASAADLEWRQSPISDAQVARLAKLRRARGSIPRPHRDLVEQLTTERGLELLSRGAASDLIAVLGVCSDQSRQSRQAGRRGTWAWPSSIPIPELVLPGRAA